MICCRVVKCDWDGEDVLVDISDDPEENYCKPAADYLFRSMSKIDPEHTLGVIMTGMGKDGCAGLELLHANGGLIYAQEKQSCTIYGMPREVVRAGIADKIVPLEDLPQALIQVAQRR